MIQSAQITPKRHLSVAPPPKQLATEAERERLPPVRWFVKVHIPQANILAVQETDQTRAALISTAVPGRIPAHHHILPQIEPRDELQSLPIDGSAPRDLHVLGILGQHDVPAAAIAGVIPLIGTPEYGRPRVDLNGDIRLEEKRCCEVSPGREPNESIPRRAGVDGGLDCNRVESDSVSTSSKLSYTAYHSGSRLSSCR